MADENADVQSNEITLDDFNGDEQESPKTAPSTVKEETKVETKEPEAKVEEETKGDDTPVPPDVPTKDEGETDSVETVETEDKPRPAEERKAQLNTEIRDLVSQRNALKAEVEKANAEVYQPATEEELVADGLSATDAKVEALRQEIEVSKYNERVADAQLTLGSESQRVLTDFSWTDPDSAEYNKELAEEASALLEANLILDPNTQQVIGSNVSPYQLYKTLDRAAGISKVKGQIEGQQATEKQLASVDSQTSAAPPKKTVDPLIELWRSDD